MKTALALFSSRETPEQLLATVEAARVALMRVGEASLLSVVINGNRKLADALTGLLRRQAPQPLCEVRVCWVAVPDKAAAWNQAVHRLLDPAALTVFVDGYATLAPNAVIELQRALQAEPGALAVSGVPHAGWSSARHAALMRREGGLHGNFYGIGAEAMQRLRNVGYALPLGLYRNDSTLGAALALGLGLFARTWAPRERIALADAPLWTVPAMRWWSAEEWGVRRRRRERQAQGRLENAAVQHGYIVKGRDIQDLPATVHGLVQRWLDEDDRAQAAMASDRRLALAWERLCTPRDWSLAAKPPECLLRLAS